MGFCFQRNRCQGSSTMKTETQRLGSGSHPPQWKILLAFAAIYIVWGSTYLAIRYGVETLPPFLMAGSRFLLAGMLLYGFARLRGAARATSLHWRNAAITGALLLLIGNGGVTWAEQVIPSGVAALLVALVPLWMVLVDWIRPQGKRPGALVFAGLAVGFLGVALLARGNGHGAGTNYSWSVVALMAASLGWAVGSVFNKHADKPASPLLGIGMQMIAGGAALLLVALGKREFASFSTDSVSAKSLAAWAYLTTAGSLIGFPAYIWLLQVSTPARVSTYAYVNPFVAVLLGCTLGNEAFTRDLFLAGVLIIAAVALIVCSGSGIIFPKFQPYFRIGKAARPDRME